MSCPLLKNGDFPSEFQLPSGAHSARHKASNSPRIGGTLVKPQGVGASWRSGWFTHQIMGFWWGFYWNFMGILRWFDEISWGFHEVSWGFYWDFIEMFVIGISWVFHADWWVPHFMASLVLTVSTVILWMIWRFRRKRVGPQIIHLMRPSRALKPMVASGTMWWSQFHNPFRKAP